MRWGEIKPLSQKEVTTAHFGQAPGLLRGKEENTEKNKRQDTAVNTKMCPKSWSQQGPSCEKHQETSERFSGQCWQGDAGTKAHPALAFSGGSQVLFEFDSGPSPHWQDAAAAAPGGSVFSFSTWLPVPPGRSPECRVQQALSCGSLTRCRHARAPLLRTIIS